MAYIDPNEALQGLLLLVDGEPGETSEVTAKLSDLAGAICQGGIAAREEILALGGYSAVARAWVYYCEGGDPADNSVGVCFNAVLRALYTLTPGFPEIIDDVGWQIIANSLDITLPEVTLINAFRLLRYIFIKSEDNREYFSWTMGLLKPLTSLITKPHMTSQYISEWCISMKSLILNDDIRVAYNRSADRKVVIGKAKILPILAGLVNHLENKGHDTKTLNSIVVFLSSMAVNEEYCLQMDSGNILHGIHVIFKNHHEIKTLVKNAASLLRRLCISEKLREKSAAFALLKSVIKLLDKYKNEQRLTEEILSCCAYLTLKNEFHINQFLAKNGLGLLYYIIKQHRQEISVVKSLSFTLRNVAENGGVHGREKILQYGFDTILLELAEELPELKHFFICPVLRLVGISFTLASNEAFLEPILEPKVSRQSMVLELEEEEEIAHHHHHHHH